MHAKAPMSRNAWVLYFAVFVHETSRASEHVKRDPHVFDLVLFSFPFTYAEDLLPGSAFRPELLVLSVYF